VCNSPKWTGDDCSIEQEVDLNMIPAKVIFICYGLAGFNYALVVLFGIWVSRNWYRNHIQMAQPMFLMVILAGCAISTSTIFAMAQEDEGDGPVPTCVVIPWLYSVGFSLTFGAMFARIRRIYLVLKYAVEMKRVAISAKETVLTAMVVVGIDVIILTLWTILDPLEWKRTTISTDNLGEILESEGHCQSESWYLYAGSIGCFHFIVMVVAMYLCYLARRIPDRIANGKYVAFALFSNFQIFVVVIPVLIMLGSPLENTSFFVRSLAIWINDLVVLVLIFGNLIYQVHQHDIDERSGRLPARSSHVRIQADLHRYESDAQNVQRAKTKQSYP
jgi:gamma-aminobutyric acid type B receptor